MRAGFLRCGGVILTLALASCGSAQVQQCESQLMQKLKAPASYNRVSVETGSSSASDGVPAYDSVMIAYDAANSFNAPLRGRELCFFRPGTTDRFNPFENMPDSDFTLFGKNTANAAENSLDAVSNAVENAQAAINGMSNEDDSADEYDDCVANAHTTAAYEACTHGKSVDE
jgi:hypothetical protein